MTLLPLLYCWHGYYYAIIQLSSSLRHYYASALIIILLFSPWHYADIRHFIFAALSLSLFRIAAIFITHAISFLSLPHFHFIAITLILLCSLFHIIIMPALFIINIILFSCHYRIIITLTIALLLRCHLLSIAIMPLLFYHFSLRSFHFRFCHCFCSHFAHMIRHYRLFTPLIITSFLLISRHYASTLFRCTLFTLLRHYYFIAITPRDYCRHAIIIITPPPLFYYILLLFSPIFADDYDLFHYFHYYAAIAWAFYALLLPIIAIASRFSFRCHFHFIIYCHILHYYHAILLLRADYHHFSTISFSPLRLILSFSPPSLFIFHYFTTLHYAATIITVIASIDAIIILSTLRIFSCHYFIFALTYISWFDFDMSIYIHIYIHIDIYSFHHHHFTIIITIHQQNSRSFNSHFITNTNRIINKIITLPMVCTHWQIPNRII